MTTATEVWLQTVGGDTEVDRLMDREAVRGMHKEEPRQMVVTGLSDRNWGGGRTDMFAIRNVKQTGSGR